MRSLLLFSGGVDSAAIAYWRRPELLLYIDYGQRPACGEIRAARAIARRVKLPLKQLRVDCSAIGSGDLCGKAQLPIAASSSWWPFRNQLLATIGAAFALQESLDAIILGIVHSDQLFADSTSGFADQMRTLLGMQEGRLRLETPAINLTTAELVATSGIPGSLLAWTHSCHVSDWACGQCKGCLTRDSILRAVIT